MKPYVTGTQAGKDIHAYEVEISYTAAACKRLGEATLLAGLRVAASHSLHNPPGHRHSVTLMVLVPEDRVDRAKELMGDAFWRTPTRPTVDNVPPPPTWGELRDMVQELLKAHRGQELPCGHPVATLVFDPVDGTKYTCPLCKQQQAEEAV